MPTPVKSLSSITEGQGTGKNRNHKTVNSENVPLTAESVAGWPLELTGADGC